MSWGLLGQPSTEGLTAAKNKDTEQIAATVNTVHIIQLSCGDSKRILAVNTGPWSLCNKYAGHMLGSGRERPTKHVVASSFDNVRYHTSMVACCHSPQRRMMCSRWAL